MCKSTLFIIIIIVVVVVVVAVVVVQAKAKAKAKAKTKQKLKSQVIVCNWLQAKILHWLGQGLDKWNGRLFATRLQFKFSKSWNEKTTRYILSIFIISE